jgi:hypothetical protein
MLPLLKSVVEKVVLPPTKAVAKVSSPTKHAVVGRHSADTLADVVVAGSYETTMVPACRVAAPPQISAASVNLTTQFFSTSDLFICFLCGTWTFLLLCPQL